MKKKILAFFSSILICLFSFSVISCSYITVANNSFPVSIDSGEMKDIFSDIFQYLSSKSKNNQTVQILESDKHIKVKILLQNNNKVFTNYNDNTLLEKNTQINIYISIKTFDKYFSSNY